MAEFQHLGVVITQPSAYSAVSIPARLHRGGSCRSGAVVMRYGRS